VSIFYFIFWDCVYFLLCQTFVWLITGEILRFYIFFIEFNRGEVYWMLRRKKFYFVCQVRMEGLGKKGAKLEGMWGWKEWVKEGSNWKNRKNWKWKVKTEICCVSIKLVVVHVAPLTCVHHNRACTNWGTNLGGPCKFKEQFGYLLKF
jgi:hypothetical protein